MLELGNYCNATSSTFDHTRYLGRANAWGNSFPAEELPPGKVITVGTVPFRLAVSDDRRDNIEALGQIMDLPKLPAVVGLALLCYGEMGKQALPIWAMGVDGRKRSRVAVAEGWLVEKDAPAQSSGHVLSHLHYNDGYECAALRPALWCWKTDWDDPFRFERLILGVNPLFHIVAITCFHG